MSEEIIENNIAGGKESNIEDANIVAQRLLNIFRQLHIFSPEKKEAFNTMILSQPKAIKDAFGKLLGGAYLKEYVDTLEKEKGTSSSGGSDDDDIDGAEKGYIEKQKGSGSEAAGNQLYGNINLEEVISNITKNQTDLISNLTKIQTQQLAEIISLSLQETYKSTTKSLVDALTSKNVDTKNIEKHIKEISENVDTDFKNNIEKTRKKFEENIESSKEDFSKNVNIAVFDKDNENKKVENKDKSKDKLPENNQQNKNKENFADKKSNEKNKPSDNSGNKNDKNNKNNQKEENKNQNQSKKDSRADSNTNKNQNRLIKEQPYNKFMDEVDIENINAPINLGSVSSSSFDDLLSDDGNDDWLWLEEDNNKQKTNKGKSDNSSKQTEKKKDKFVEKQAPSRPSTPVKNSNDDDIDLGYDEDEWEDDDGIYEEIKETPKQKPDRPQNQPKTSFQGSAEENSDDDEWEWEYEYEYDGEPASNEEDWEWEYEEIEDDAPNDIDEESVTFEERPLYPEREKEQKPAPLTSEAVIENEGVFKFDNFEAPEKEKKEDVAPAINEKPPASNVSANKPAPVPMSEEGIIVPLSSKDLLKNTLINSKEDAKELASNFPEAKVIKEEIEELDLGDLVAKEEKVEIPPLPEIKAPEVVIPEVEEEKVEPKVQVKEEAKKEIKEEVKPEEPKIEEKKAEEKKDPQKSVDSAIDDFIDDDFIDESNALDITIEEEPVEKIVPVVDHKESDFIDKTNINDYLEDLEKIDEKKFIPSSSKELLEMHNKNKEKLSKELENVKIGLASSDDDENIDNLYK